MPLAPPPAPPAPPALPTLPAASAPVPIVVPPLPIHHGVDTAVSNRYDLDAAARRAELARRRRRRARVFTSIVLLFVLAGCAGVVLIVIEQREGNAARTLPDGPIEPYGSRSATITEHTVLAGVAQSGTFYVDLPSSTVYYDGREGDVTDVVFVDGRWFGEESGAWYSFEPPVDQDQERAYFVQADGFSVAEAVPPSVRDYVDYVAVEEVVFDGLPMRRFDLLVRDDDMERRDPEAFAAFVAVWGEPSDERPADLPENARVVGTNLSLWIDDAGWVWQWESKADFNSDSITVTIDALSTEPYAYPVPVEGQPVTGPLAGAAPAAPAAPTLPAVPTSVVAPPPTPVTIPPLTLPVFGTAAP